MTTYSCIFLKVMYADTCCALKSNWFSERRSLIEDCNTFFLLLSCRERSSKKNALLFTRHNF